MSLKTASARRRSLAATIGAAAASAVLLAGCSAADLFAGNEFFSESSMGVKASPRVTTSRNVPKGGGRYQVGAPYTVAGRTFTPREQPDLDVTGQASWYGPAFHGRLTANGEVFDQYHLSAAHPTLPLPSYVRVTNTANGASTIVRVNDRGPFSHDRVIDLSRRTAEVLGFINQGMTDVRVQYVGPAPLQGDDTRFLVASINQLTPYEINSGTRMAYGDVQVAQTEPAPSPSALDAANSAATPVNLPFQLLSYGVDIAATPALPEPTGTPVLIGLGRFTDSDAARDIAARFAVLGAVDTTTIAQGDQSVTQLTLNHLREGVTAADVAQLAASLGLADPIPY
ncbi:septal ring lytic transglycosylase RlpA family protein [Pelagibacterium lacus]|uniref:Endolytic peptidoglycan transglycosylase RlpA n=1 Tax=Pelagibacterium lacus TaxID=2282655 RepID=A0A369W5I0_9HYPH|nr:septal ring lytic transglycosylase RlpA family protein [Pelagibacterium lacus]RDE08620.1 septal ring lytic transglycosylase RlpA family protein [Pelagibacterium lacus]